MEFAVAELKSYSTSIRNKYTQKSQACSRKEFTGLWVKDEALHVQLSILKKSAERISHSCTKFSLIALNSTNPADIDSFLQEFMPFVVAYIQSFDAVLQSGLSWPLFQLICVQVRSQITHVHDLFEAALQKKTSYLPSATGMVWSTCEEIQKIPMSNKVSYRRAFMEMISTIKDTTKEFNEYIAEADKLYGTPTSSIINESIENPEEDVDSRDSGDVPYTQEENFICKDCIDVMKCATSILKVCLSLTTKIMDSSACKPDSRRYYEQWMAHVVDASDVLQEGVVDLSSELFTPFDHRVIECKFVNCKEKAAITIATLLDEEILKNNPDVNAEELMGLVEMIKNCSLCIS